MKHLEPIVNVMTRDTKTVQLDDRLSSVRRMFMEGNFHHVPILDGQELVGIISARDIMRLSYEVYGLDREAIDTTLDERYSIADVMQTQLVTMRVDERVEKAVDLLGDGSIHSVLILDEDDCFGGIVTNIDLLEYLFA